MIQAIVLAAGFGKRMGRTKPLIDVDGQPALAVVLGRIRTAGVSRPIVVLGHRETEIRAAVDLSGCRVTVNLLPERGMGSSLAAGIAALPGETDGVLVFHADMPFVRARTIRAVLSAAAAGARIAAPAHLGRRGFPIFFHRSCLSGLLETLDGDEGGRAYVRDQGSDVTLVNVDDPGCVSDLDHPSDFARSEGGATCATSA
jgi:CTP:molybdopterin cytidylyltransferase MocA